MYIYTPVGAPMGSTVSSSTTYTLPGNANAFLIQAITQNVRIQLDGTDPTAAVGMQIKAGDSARLLAIGGGRSFKALQESATAYFFVQPVVVNWVNP